MPNAHDPLPAADAEWNAGDLGCGELVLQLRGKLKEMMANFAAADGKMYVCSPCFQKRSLDENNLVPGAVVVGGAKRVEFMGDACPSVSY